MDKNTQNLVQSHLNEFQSPQPESIELKNPYLQKEGQKQCQSQQIPEIRQQLMIDYRYPDFIQYFQSKEIYNKKSKEMSSGLLDLTEFQVQNDIKSGYLKISNSTIEIGKVAPPEPSANKQIKVKQILNKKIKLELQLKGIQQQLENLGENKDQKQQKKDQLGQVQHKKFIQRMMKIRRAAENKRKIMLQHEKEKLMKQIKKQQQERKLSQQKIKKQKQQSIKKKLEQRQKEKNKQQQQQNASIKRYKQALQRKRIHQIMKQKYQSSVLLPILQQQKQILKERSTRFRGYSIDQIRNFEKQYEKSRQQRMFQLSNGSKQTWQYKPPSYSPRIYKILQQEKVKQKIRIEQQKRAVEQKIQRKSNYAQYVKESISIRIDQKKKLQLLLLNKPKTITQTSNLQLKNIGNKYMREGMSVKSEIRKDNYSLTQFRQEKTEVSKNEKKKSNTSLNQSEHQKFIREIHKDRINKILTSKDIEKTEKIQKLKVQAKKINERIKRKQEMKKVKSTNKQDDNIQQLLASIKAKVGMMDLFKQ